MSRIRNTLGEHRHFFVITSVLTLIMTFPTIVYVFRTDVFWLPTGDGLDVLIHLWDVWYGKQVLSRLKDPFYTDLIFYPDGVSLASHPLFYLHSVVVNVLHMILPLSNAYSLTYLLIIFSTTLATYVYLLWMFKDKSLALFGAIVFGFSPSVNGLPNWPEVSWLATMPLAVYSIHRGTWERRAGLIVLAGLMAGLSSTVTLYHYVCVLITLGLFACAFAVSRWRDKVYWQYLVLLIAATAVASAWRLAPMFQDAPALATAIKWQGQSEQSNDLISFFVDSRNPFVGPLGDSVFQPPEHTRTSYQSYLGYVPLALIFAGLFHKATRQLMMPWLGLLLVFLVLRLGSILNVNGTVYENILLPKYYLNQLMPVVFQAFRSADHFMAGARLPLAILSCYGIIALRHRFPAAAASRFILALIAIVSFEYFVPVKSGPVLSIGDGTFSNERLAFVDWLDQEEDDEVRLINLPMGRKNSKFYLFYQSLHGYPQTEGAISRTPDSAYDFIRANYLLNTWYDGRSVECSVANRDAYRAALEHLETVGFSHVVYYSDLLGWAEINGSFQSVSPSYTDDFVSIFRMDDLRAGCP